jgi:hypothetical protein
MTDTTMAQARAALRDVVPSLVTLVRSVPDANSVSVGTWTVGDVAAHLSHVLRFDTDALAGRPVPEATVTAAGMAEVNAKMLAEEASSTGCKVSACRLSAVACHLLEECLVHGHDIARAVGRPWSIRCAAVAA